MRSGTASMLLAAALATSVADAQVAEIDNLVAQCRAGNGDACTAAGARYQLGRGVPQRFGAAVDLYTRGCDNGAMLACGLLGAMYAGGRGVPRDEPLAVTLFRRGCDGGHEHTCGQYGLMVVSGHGAPRDVAGAAPFLARGCAANHWGACDVLGRMSLRGVGVPRDVARGSRSAARLRGGYRAACVADPGVTEFAAPPPVTGGLTFEAPPPVTGSTTFAAPPPVAPPPAVAPRATPRVTPRPVYVRPPYRRVTTTASVRESPVSFLGGSHRASSFFLGGEFSVVRSDSAANNGFFGLGFRHSRGPVEFLVDARFGGGTLAPSVPGDRSWSAFVLGTGVGVNLLSWPRSDRERFSVINLSGGVNAAYGFGAPEGASAFRVGGYVANTTFFLCWLGVRAEFVGSLVGENTWGHTLYASLFFGGRPRSQCR
ncbi:MAG: tetratricopeptide repeat protein [Polyangiales bacterium]